MNEEWKQVVGYEGYYEVSDLGRVRSLDRIVPCQSGTRLWKGRVLDSFDDGGYKRVALSIHGKPRKFRVHCLVAAAFIGPRPDNLFVCHGNDIRHDNRVSNLRYDTVQGNACDSIKNGCVSKGVEHWRSKLTPDDVRNIRERLSHGETQKSIGSIFCVSQGTIYDIRARKTWRHVI